MEIILLIVCVGLYLYFTSAYSKGNMGEYVVQSILSQLPDSEYSIINDISLHNEFGSVQIDHIVVSPYGIFVIETKNYSGWIMGSQKSDKWIKNMYGHKYYFYNPIRQNYAHIAALSKTLHIQKNNFISIVAFSNRADLKVQTSEYVVYFKQIISIILSYSKKIFSNYDVDKIASQLLLIKSGSKKEIKEHIQYVRNKRYFSESARQQGFCPYCGAALKMRNGKYGKFVGCSRYPKCKYTHSL